MAKRLHVRRCLCEDYSRCVASSAITGYMALVRNVKTMQNNGTQESYHKKCVNLELAKRGNLVLLRHGQTAWSVSGQHTGRTDLPLTDVGMQQACDAGERLREAFPQGFDPDCVLVSPLRRAQQTAQLAGYVTYEICRSALEWDYGGAEGRTRGDIAALSGVDAWDVWKHGPQVLPSHMISDGQEVLPNGEAVDIHRTSGESLQEVSDRTQKIIDAAMPQLAQGRNVLVVAHAHVLRILTARWLGVNPDFARLLRLDTAHYAVLGEYKGDNVIVHWNC